MQNSMLELEQSVEPSSWSLLTISDCNLCALLSMVETSESTKALLTQLTGVLDQNIQRAFMLDEAIEMNNYGLPEDMYKDTRSRRMRFCTNMTASTGVDTSSSGGGGGTGSKKKNMESTLQAALSNLCSHNNTTQNRGVSSSSRSTEMTVESGGITTDTPKSVVSASSICTAGSLTSNVTSVAVGSAQRADVLNVLSKSPHIIVCYPKQGSASYIVTVPASSSSSQTATQAPGRRILPSPGGIGVDGSSISSKMVSLLVKSSEKGKTLSRKPDKSTLGKSHQNGSNLSAEVIKDYDAEKFSQFANILVNMDSIGGLRSTEDAKENATVNHRQQQQSRTHLLTSSGSDAEFTDSLESDSSATHQAETALNRQEELMDFASIVNSAVSFNPEAGEKGQSPILSLPPEVPMSWLETATSTTNPPQALLKSPSVTTTSSFISTTATSCNVSADDSAGVVSDTLHKPEKSLGVPSSPRTTTATTTTTTTTTLETSGPWNSDENDGSLGELAPAGATQVQVEVIDQPMAEVEPLDNSSSTNHDFLDVSLDLDPESLQQLLTFSSSPELHLSSTCQQSQPGASTNDAHAPLSPISQLFDSLEPPGLEDPGLTDSDISSVTLATTQGDLRVTNSRLQDTAQEHILDNPDNPQNVLDGQTSNVKLQQPLTREGQNVGTLFGASVGQSNAQLPAPGLEGGDVVTSSWAPSPNSLQLWLESTDSELHCTSHCCITLFISK